MTTKPLRLTFHRTRKQIMAAYRSGRELLWVVYCGNHRTIVCSVRDATGLHASARLRPWRCRRCGRVVRDPFVDLRVVLATERQS